VPVGPDSLVPNFFLCLPSFSEHGCRPRRFFYRHVSLRYGLFPPFRSPLAGRSVFLGPPHPGCLFFAETRPRGSCWTEGGIPETSFFRPSLTIRTHCVRFPCQDTSVDYSSVRLVRCLTRRSGTVFLFFNRGLCISTVSYLPVSPE